MAAVAACPKAEDCNPDSPRKNPELVGLLKDAEAMFVEACAQCATDGVCEEERGRIRAGRGRMGSNVCVPDADKAAKSGDKKPAPATKPPATSTTPPK